MVKKIGNNNANTINGTFFNDKIYGLGGDDFLNGRSGNDKIYGGDGNDTISGGRGKDKLYGEAGDDTIHGDKGDDYIEGGEGQDTLYGDAGDDVMVDYSSDGNGFAGGDGNDVIIAGGGAAPTTVVSYAYGNNGDDTLVSGDGNSGLIGGEGNDHFYGGSGMDYMWGGNGADTFHFSDGDGRYSNLVAGSDDDIVFDFQDGIDQFDLSGVSGLTAFSGLTIANFNDSVGGAGAYVDYGTGSFFVAGVTATQLDAGDFIV